MLGLKQKALITAIVVGMNLAVALLMTWFVVFSAIPSAMLLFAVLTR